MTAAVASSSAQTEQDPTKQLETLVGELALLREGFDDHDAYYRGDPPLAQDPQRLTESYRELLEMSRSNWCRLVVDVVAERLVVEGVVSSANHALDETAWTWWQANNLDAYSGNVHREALKFGVTYVGVEPGGDGEDGPRISGQLPTQVHVRYDPERPSRAIDAVKVWRGRDDYLYATLYTPETIYKYRSEDPLGQVGKDELFSPIPPDKIGNVSWVQRSDAEGGAVLGNPMGVVPYVRFACQPGLTADEYTSEIEGIKVLQRRINKTTFHRMLAQEFTAFPQRWATGMDIPLDDNGEPIETLDAAVDRVWTAVSPETRFGQFPPGNAEPYLRAEQSDVQALATQSRTPPHYLTGGMGVFPSGESVRATEYGLSRKVGDRQLIFGEAWAEVIRLAALAAGDTALATDRGIDVRWADVEARTEGEIVDALLKMDTLGVPRKVLWERWGATPQEVERWEAEAAAQAEQMAAQAGAQTAPEPSRGEPAPEPSPGGEPEPTAPSQTRASAF